MYDSSKSEIRVFLIGTGASCKEFLKILSDFPRLKLCGIATEANDPISKEKNVEIFHIGRKNRKALAEFIQNRKPDILLSITSPFLLPEEILNIPRLLALNLHPGVLPQYAGFYTHLWAIINGENRFGVTLHKMVEKVDAGSIFSIEWFDLLPTETGISAYLKCVKASGNLLRRFFSQLMSDKVHFESQDLSLQRLYKKREIEELTVSPMWDSKKIWRTFKAHQFRPFPSPIGDLKISLNEEIFTIQKMNFKEVSIDTDVPTGFIISMKEDGVEIKCKTGTITLITLNGENAPDLLARKGYTVSQQFQV